MYTHINLIKVICGNTTLPFKIEIRVVYSEGNMCKDTKNHELQKINCSIFQLASTGSRNQFHRSCDL